MLQFLSIFYINAVLSGGRPKYDFEEIYKAETMALLTLRRIIYRTDCDLGRYFEYHQDTTVEAIDEFIKYLVSTGILCRPGGMMNGGIYFQQLPVSGISDGLLYDTESVYAGGKPGSGNAH